MINGHADRLTPWQGGPVAPMLRQERGYVWSVPKTIAFWRAHKGCAGSPGEHALPDRGPSDGTRVIREGSGPCRDGSEVVLYRIEGGGHGWPGFPQPSVPPRMKRIIGNLSRDIDAASVVWEFFRKHWGKAVP